MGKDNNKYGLNAYVKYSNIAFQMIAIIVLSILGGNYLDKKTSLNFPLFTLIGSLTGLAVSFYLLIKKLK